MCRSCQALPCRVGRRAGQSRLAAAAAADGLLSPASQPWSLLLLRGTGVTRGHWRRGTSHCVPSPLPVPPYRLPWGFAGAPQGGNEDRNLTGAVLRDKHLGVKSERALLMNPWSSALKMPGWAEKVLCPPKQPRYPGTRMGARAGDTPGPPRHY